MNPLHIVSVVVGAAGAVSAYLVSADPAHASLWQSISGVCAALVPAFAMGVAKLGAKS